MRMSTGLIPRQKGLRLVHKLPILVVRQEEALRPRTATKPIQLCEYIQRQARSRAVDDARLTPEWKAWYDKRYGKVMCSE